ncbi:Uncharacterised protein [Vibrio cholerae]|nr:Uncharacterised protein [Vibrio cholerae]
MISTPLVPEAGSRKGDFTTSNQINSPSERSILSM